MIADLTGGLGTTGLLVYLVVKEALAFSRRSNGRQRSGELDPAAWRETITAIVHEEVKPVLEAIRDLRFPRSP